MKALILLFSIASVILATPQTVAVLQFKGNGVSETETEILTSKLEVELFRNGSFMVLERKEMGAILQEQEFQQSGCTSSECAVEIGQILGVTYMVAGDVSRIGEVFYCNIRMIDVATSAVLNHINLELTNSSFSDILNRTVPTIADQLSGDGEAKPKANVLISTYNWNGHILLNGEQVGIKQHTVQLPLGNYFISEIDKKSGKELHSEMLSITDTVPKRVHLGGKRVQFTFSPSLSTVFPGTANPVPYENSRPKFSTTFIAPGFQVGVTVADKHYHGFMSHFRFAAEMSGYDREKAPHYVKPFYLGGFYIYQREWRIGKYFKTGAGGVAGLRATAVSFIVPESDLSDTGTYYYSSREEFGGPAVSLGFGTRNVTGIATLIYAIGTHQIDTEYEYGHVRVSASPELNISVRISPFVN